MSQSDIQHRQRDYFCNRKVVIVVIVVSVVFVVVKREGDSLTGWTYAGLSYDVFLSVAYDDAACAIRHSLTHDVIGRAVRLYVVLYGSDACRVAVSYIHEEAELVAGVAELERRFSADGEAHLVRVLPVLI